MSLRSFLVSLGLVAMVVLSGCQVAGTGSDLGGDRLPVQTPEDPIPHPSVPVTGILTLESNGCWSVDLGDEARVVAFPVGTTRPPDDGTVLVVPSGLMVTSGMTFDGIGGVTAIDGLPGGADGFWGSYVAFCDPSAAEVAVLDTLAPALDVGALDDQQIAARIDAAALTTMWGCGIGFAASDDDQTVAIHLYALDAGSTLAQEVAFPDPLWSATVTMGSLLMANHCDDVVEPWEAEPKVAVTVPLTAGTLAFGSPPDPSCGGEGAMATLTGATVIVDGSTVVIDDLTLDNDAFGCFAG